MRLYAKEFLGWACLHARVKEKCVSRIELTVAVCQVNLRLSVLEKVYHATRVLRTSINAAACK